MIDKPEEMKPQSEDLALPGRARGMGASEDPSLCVAAQAPIDKTHFAGFFIRGIAFFIDLVILNVLFLVLVLVGNSAMKIGLKGMHLESSSDELIRFLLGIYPPVWFFLFFTYFTFFTAYGGQTPAKMLLRIRVLTKDQQPLTWWKAALRTIGYFISGFLLLGLGFLVTIFHPRKRALHDLIAGTMVMKDASHS